MVDYVSLPASYSNYLRSFGELLTERNLLHGGVPGLAVIGGALSIQRTLWTDTFPTNS